MQGDICKYFFVFHYITIKNETKANMSAQKNKTALNSRQLPKSERSQVGGSAPEGAAIAGHGTTLHSRMSFLRDA